MTQFVTIDECETEVGYLRDQNQKLIRELSDVVKENALLRDQLLMARRQGRNVLEETGKN